MSKFILNPKFKTELSKCLDDWAKEIFTTNDDVISVPRVWEDWETSDPYRDIVDSEDLRNSGKVVKNGLLSRTMQWEVPYVGYVYHGYSLADGRSIPPRKWVEIAYYENNYRANLIEILLRKKY